MVLLTVSPGLGTESSLSGYTANRMLKACNKNKTDNLIAFFFMQKHIKLIPLVVALTSEDALRLLLLNSHS